MARQIGKMLHAREPKIVNGPGLSLLLYQNECHAFLASEHEKFNVLEFRIP